MKMVTCGNRRAELLFGSITPYGLKTSTEEKRKGYPGFPTIYEQKSKHTMLEIWRVILNRRFSVQRNDQDRGCCTEIKSRDGREVAIRRAKVIVDNSAKYLSTLNKASVLKYCAGNGHLLIDTLMGARSVVVLSKFDQDAPQMIGIDDESMIQAFFPNSANPPFGMSICIGSLKRSANDIEASGLENGIKDLAEGTVIVVD